MSSYALLVEWQRLFVGRALSAGAVPELVVGLLFASILVIASVTDVRDRIISNKLMLFAIGTGALLRGFIHPLPLWSYWAAFTAGGLSLYLLALLGRMLYKKDAMGGGDIKLLAVIGLFTGLKAVIVAMLAASMAGFLLIGALALLGRYKRGDAIPFGPCLAIGGLSAYLWAEPLINSYQQWLLSLV
jgi:leader peptidase (prepilin peptidase) / N-methyltransferase